MKLSKEEKKIIQDYNLKFDYYYLFYFLQEHGTDLDFDEYCIVSEMIAKKENELIKEIKNTSCKYCSSSLTPKYDFRDCLYMPKFCSDKCYSKYKIELEKYFEKLYQYTHKNISEKQKNIKKLSRSKIRARLKYLLTNPNYKNKDNFFELIGCSIQNYKNHIEKYFQFDKEMKWENYGVYWEIDHIVPLDSFNLEDESDLKNAFNYINTRALTVEDNRLLNNVLNKNAKYWTPFSHLTEEKRKRIIDLKKVKIDTNNS